MSTSCKLVCVAVVATCVGVTIAADTSAPQDRPPARYTETITTEDGGKISFEMVLIPGGSFLMGSPAGQAGRGDNEGPQYKVRLDPFYLCTTETTLELFLLYYQETVSARRDFVEVQQAKKNAEEQATTDDVDATTGPTPVYGDLTMGYDNRHPAIGMTWHNAMTFCRWLSRKTGKTYRLPTEAQWEYACRAGTTGVFGFGDDPSRIEEYAWCKANSDSELHEVAKKKPNAWGLYDTLGNVREWVNDFYSPAAYEEAAEANPTLNPTGPKTGKVHVARGGDYRSPVEELRCAARAFEEPWWRMKDPQMPKSKWWLPEMDIIGLRVARSADTSAEEPAKPAFTLNKEGGYSFDTGVLRGKLRQAGKSPGLSSVVHVPSGVRVDGGAGILSYYRVFTTNKRYGPAAWDWPSHSELLADGAIQITWPDAADRPFEMVAVYRWKDASTLDIETIVKPKKDLNKFEVFLASYFHEAFPSPYVSVAVNPKAEGKPGFLIAGKSSGDWQMFPRDEQVLQIVQDGRWNQEPNPVKWVIMPKMAVPLAMRRQKEPGLTTVLMAPPDDCFAVATPYEGESHYSLYLSLFGRDVKAGETAKAHSRFVVTTATSDQQILELYQKYVKDLAGRDIPTDGP